MTNKAPNLKESLALLLSTLEVSLGSMLHAFHVPLRGQLLSLNQLFVLSYLYRCRPKDTWAPLEVSLYTASMKFTLSWSQRIMPAASIVIQGFLFNSGTLLRAPVLGGAVASLWSLVAPILMLWTLSLGDGWAAFLWAKESAESFGVPMMWILFGIFISKMIAAGSVCLLAQLLPTTVVLKYFESAQRFKMRPIKKSGLRISFLGFGFAVLFLYYLYEDPHHGWVHCLRTLGMFFIIETLSKIVLYTLRTKRRRPLPHPLPMKGTTCEYRSLF